jgi:23S rRNA U2552 (ribose-2'-O)-methylase RlmE/FtsJ
VNKVHEAILVSGMNLDNLGWALDLGAAPGGWTKYLAEHAK